MSPLPRLAFDWEMMCGSVEDHVVFYGSIKEERSLAVIRWSYQSLGNVGNVLRVAVRGRRGGRGEMQQLVLH